MIYNNSWKLIYSSLYYDPEVELVTIIGKQLNIQIETQLSDLQYHLNDQLPILVIGSNIFRRKEIIKFISTVFLNYDYQLYLQQSNSDMNLDIFDLCYQMLDVIDYYMWRDPSQYYNYRSSYFGFQYPLQVLEIRKINKKLKQKELDTAFQSQFKGQQLIQKLQDIIQNDEQLNYFHLLIYLIFKSITTNVRPSKLSAQVIQSPLLREFIYIVQMRLIQNPQFIGQCDKFQEYLLKDNQQLEAAVIFHRQIAEQVHWSNKYLKIAAVGLLSYISFKE